MAPFKKQAASKSRFDAFVLSALRDTSFMAIAEAYFDDSGTHVESTTAIAGCFISTVKQWRRFTSEWEEVAAKSNFRTFHMAEFASCKGEFIGWPNKKRERVLTRLCALINKYSSVGTAVGVVKADYESAIQGDFRNYCGRYHYTFVVRHCAKGPRKWLNEHPGSSIQYIFDQMGKGKGEIMNVMDDAMERSRQRGETAITGYSFEDKSRFAPLQAADILAWSYYQYIQHKSTGARFGWMPQVVMDTLVKGNLWHKFYDRPTLTSWARREIEALSRPHDPNTVSQ